MDFGALPPEINSARMYAGAGATPMMAAAAAWNSLAAELSTTATSFESVITQLAAEQWMGPASLAMVAAAQPFVAWFNYTAEATALAGSQATASAAAFETAFAMTVPPAAVAANRALLAQLVATNVLGQNTPAIAATEAQYGEMWAQDALAMYGYAAASAVAGKLTPLTAPAQPTNPAGVVGQAAAVNQAAASSSVQQVGLNNLVSKAPDTVRSLAAPVAAAPAAAPDVTGLVQDTINGAVNTGAWFTTAGIVSAIFLGHTLNTMPAAGAAAAAVPGAAAAALATTVAPAGVGGAPLLAGMGTASSVGGLSVPAAWSTAAPAGSPVTAGATALEGSGWTVPEEEAAIAGVPGAPGMAIASKGAGAYAGPRYGVKPVVMPKLVVV
jgi:PPE-repeat protein